MSDFYDAGKHGAIIAIPFGVINAVTSAAAVDLTEASIAQGTLAIMPHSGSVVGISVSASAAVSAGEVDFQAHKDSTEFPQTGFPNPTLNTTYTNESYASIRPGVLTFDAGDGIGISYDSATDAAPTNTNDYSAILFVQLDPN